MGFWGDLIGIGGDIAGAVVGMPWLGTAATAIGGALNSGTAAKSAANQQVQAGQQAAQTFQPYMQGANQAYNKALGMYGIAPIAPATPQAPASPVAIPRPQGPSAIPTYGINTLPQQQGGTATLNTYGLDPRLQGVGVPSVNGGSSYGAQ